MADDMSDTPRAGPGPGVGAGIHGAGPQGPGVQGAGPQGAAAQGAGAPGARRGKLRARLFAGLGAVVALGAVIFLVWYLLVGSHQVSTDNAYVGADVAQVTPQVSGQVLAVNVADTEAVKAGDILVEIDQADARLAVAQAEAEYARAQRRVRQNLATNGALGAQITARDADLLRAKAQLTAAGADLERARVDLQRRQALAASGAVSGEELTSSKNAFATAAANLEAVRAAGAQAQANRIQAVSQQEAQAALTSGAGVDDNPEVAAAQSMLDVAKLNLARTTLRAPFDGVVAKRNVQVGQRVAPGAALLTVVPTDKVYVDANFKEVQLSRVKPGQTAELTSDLYGKKVSYRGRVVGFAGGTGSAFAVIPAQNATGNWIKVVQRLPVRIALDPRDLRAHPLRVGLSMEAKIDLESSTRGGGVPR